MHYLFVLFSMMSLAGPLTVEELDEPYSLSVEQGRQLYAAADRVATTDAACAPEDKDRKELSLGYSNTFIAAAWRQKKLKDTLACQKAVLVYFACMESLSCEERKENEASDDSPHCAPAYQNTYASCKG